MKQFEIEVEQVTGHCSYSYRQGDKIICNGYDTPAGFCGGAYVTLFPIIVALSSGARFDFEDNPLSKTKMACPDNGNVIFKVTLLE
ncbi:MAG: TIGR04076 family protein [Deltaproteobacteria bacterium]|nr:TIGR04076 family protein [Candidatus Zymogenaceae bacterium]